MKSESSNDDRSSSLIQGVPQGAPWISIEGPNSADSERVRMLTAFGAYKRQVFRKVKFPSAPPFIFAGLEIGVIFAILVAVVAEFLGVELGLGVLLLQTQYNFDIPSTFALLIVLSLMGLIEHTVIVLLK